MALLHQAQLIPSKPEMLQAWVPQQIWTTELDLSGLEVVGAYRFDDPDDEVGIETHLLRTAGGRFLQVPVTYRGAPLADAGASLITTMEHSVLGRRWVYDATADPVYAATLATTILTGGVQAELSIATEAGTAVRPPTTFVSGSGTPGTPVPAIDAVRRVLDGTVTTVHASGVDLLVLHLLDKTVAVDDAATLTGTWPGRDEPTLLALAR